MRTSKKTAQEAVLRPEELADRWKISYETVKKKLAIGEIPSFRVGKQYRIPMAWVLEQEASR